MAQGIRLFLKHTLNAILLINIVLQWFRKLYSYQFSRAVLTTDLQRMNETQIPFWECSRTPDNSSVNSSALSVEVNATCSNASIIQKFKPTRPKGEDKPMHVNVCMLFSCLVFFFLLHICFIIIIIITFLS